MDRTGWKQSGAGSLASMSILLPYTGPFISQALAILVPSLGSHLSCVCLMKVLFSLPPEALPGVRIYGNFKGSGYKPGTRPVSSSLDALNLTCP